MLGSIFAADPELRAKISIHTKCNNGQLPHKSLSKVRDSSDALVLYPPGGASAAVAPIPADAGASRLGPSYRPQLVTAVRHREQTRAW